MIRLFILWIFSISFLFGTNTLSSYYYKSKSDIYKDININEFYMALDLFKELLENKNLSAKSQKSLLLLNLEIIDLENNIYIIKDKKNSGRGFYLINYDPMSKNMISIPHRFFDEYTGNIGLKMFEESSFKAIAFNSVHRKIEDMAHSDITIFNAFHLAFSKIYSQDMIYQLHGFNNDKRDSDIAKNKAEIILSNTTKYPDKQVNEITLCLKEKAINSFLYGKDIFELGGTLNAQAKLLKENNSHNFIHIEINESTRELLNKDIKTRNKILGCLK